ncbi:hypothetical protein E3P84_02088 [Wallemia ichthyophaga]|nr:hypothetical protein E3P84_02088 [Wallemia ichthyophaga]TIB41344.1 hypothetical protein E3P83_02113 [Wallemia ichthyophaga]
MSETKEGDKKNKNGKNQLKLSNTEIIGVIERVVSQSTVVDTWDLSKAGIDTLPVQVINLIKQDTCRLALSYNRLAGLPNEILQLGKLRYLNLRANMLSTFPVVLTHLPNLEILELGRNKIKKLPKHPGCLANLKVFSISKNRLTRIPDYLSNFHNLRIIKLDSNPIEWPPPDAFDSFNHAASSVTHPDYPQKHKLDLEMEAWVAALRRWLRHNPDSGTQNDTHDSTPSNTPSPFNPPTPDTPNNHYFSPTLDVYNSDYASKSSHASHGRNASSSAIFPKRSINQELKVKKSLPDMRHGSNRIITDPTPLNATLHRDESLSFAVERKESVDLPPIPTLPSSLSGFPGPSSVSETETSEHNCSREYKQEHYPATPLSRNIEHLQKQALHSSTVSTTYKHRHTPTPPSPLSISNTDIIVDAANNLLFALSQTHSAISHLVTLTHSDFAVVVGPLLNSAAGGLDPLFRVLGGKVHSGNSVHSAHSSNTIEDLTDAVKMASRAFSPLIAELRARVAGRFVVDAQFVHPVVLRMVVLTLYGSMSEIANVWRVMSGCVGGVSGLSSVSGGDRGGGGDRNENQLQHQQAQKPLQPLQPNQLHQPHQTRSIDKSTKKVYRQGVSLTQADFDYVHSHNSAQSSTLAPSAPNTPSDRLPYLDVDNPRTPTSRSPEPGSTTAHEQAQLDGHVRERERDDVHSQLRTPSPHAHPAQLQPHQIDTLKVAPRTPRASTPDDAGELVELIGSCVEVGGRFWPVLDEDVASTSTYDDGGDSVHKNANTNTNTNTRATLKANTPSHTSDPIMVELRDKSNEAKLLTAKLAQDLEVVKSARNAYGVGGLRAADAACVKVLFEHASAFNKMVIWMASLVKGLGEMRRLPLKTRRRMQMIMDLVSELTVQLHVSQYRPLAPSPNSAALNMASGSGSGGVIGNEVNGSNSLNSLNSWNSLNSTAPRSPKSAKSSKSTGKKSREKGLGMAAFPAPVLSRSQSSMPANMASMAGSMSAGMGMGKRPSQPRSATNFGAGLSKVFSPTSYADSKKRGGSVSGYSASSDSTSYE